MSARKTSHKNKKPSKRSAKRGGARKRPSRAKPTARKKTSAPAKGKAKSPRDVKAKTARGAEATAAPATRPAPAAPRPRKSSRRSSLALRRGPDGELLSPGDLLLPGGANRIEEAQYLFRGCVAAERPVSEEGVNEILSKKGATDLAADRQDLMGALEAMRRRFDAGTIEPLLPMRKPPRRDFPGVVERAKHRRREIGAFLRGLDLGHTETSHMDSHGEASLQSLMEWAARLEILADADEPGHADYTQFHRVLDQLESTTEALVIDVEQTLRRLRDRLRA
jgi:hypothetical protein